MALLGEPPAFFQAAIRASCTNGSFSPFATFLKGLRQAVQVGFGDSHSHTLAREAWTGRAAFCPSQAIVKGDRWSPSSSINELTLKRASE